MAVLAVLLLPAAQPAYAQQPRNLMDVIRQNNGGCDPGTQNCASNSAGAGAPAQCSPGDAGAMCNMRAPEGDAANINTGAGNPINIITGNKYQPHVMDGIGMFIDKSVMMQIVEDGFWPRKIHSPEGYTYHSWKNGRVDIEVTAVKGKMGTYVAIETYER